jgi:DMSO reductase family type II enzyme heme b subunit
MGDKTSPVDVWFWDADRQSGPAAAEEAYPNAVFDVLPFSETVVASAEMNRPGARHADQPDISLPARATGNQIVPTSDESGGSSLHAGGPRTITFRVTQSQLVEARGTWSDGRWTVVMMRPLSVPSADDPGAPGLEPGGRASIAFAVWDGLHQDRDGQKSITIWQDLEIEK